MLGTERKQLVGRPHDTFWGPMLARSINLWQDFMRTGRATGLAWSLGPEGKRITSYRARADILPGQHVSIATPLAPASYDIDDPWSRLAYLRTALAATTSVDELGEIVAARGWEVCGGAAATGLFVRSPSGWRLAEAGLASAMGLGAWLGGHPLVSALLSRASRRLTPLVFDSRQAMLRTAPELASLRIS